MCHDAPDVGQFGAGASHQRKRHGQQMLRHDHDRLAPDQIVEGGVDRPFHRVLQRNDGAGHVTGPYGVDGHVHRGTRLEFGSGDGVDAASRGLGERGRGPQIGITICTGWHAQTLALPGPGVRGAGNGGGPR